MHRGAEGLATSLNLGGDGGYDDVPANRMRLDESGMQFDMIVEGLSNAMCRKPALPVLLASVYGRCQHGC